MRPRRRDLTLDHCIRPRPAAPEKFPQSTSKSVSPFSPRPSVRNCDHQHLIVTSTPLASSLRSCLLLKMISSQVLSASQSLKRSRGANLSAKNDGGKVKGLVISYLVAVCLILIAHWTCTKRPHHNHVRRIFEGLALGSVVVVVALSLLFVLSSGVNG